MDQGLYISGVFYPMRSREDVADARLQHALEVFHGKSKEIQCACRYAEGENLPMESICRSTVQPEKPRYRVDRRDKNDHHHPACIHCRKTDEDPAAYLEPTSSIFLVPRPREHGIILPRSAAVGGRWTGFTQYTRRLWSAGYTGAFVEVNQGALGPRDVRNPSASQVFKGIEVAIRGWKFPGGVDGFSITRQMGLMLMFGIGDWDLRNWQGEEKSGCVEQLHAWVAADGRLLSCRLRVPVALLAAAADTVSVFGRPLKPPFLFQAVAGRDGVLTHIVLNSVLFDGYDILFSDSAGETGYYRSILNSGKAIYRGLDSLRDYENLVPPHLQVCTLPNGTPWPYNPDGLVYGHPFSDVVECRGFTTKPQDFKDYHLRFDRKRAQLTSLLRGTTARFQEEVSANFRNLPGTRTTLGGEAVIREYPVQPLQFLRQIP